ncbi:MAG: CoB--CoM heterodisulfide reductase iron-sulfur subunit B family protein [Actinomycetota bacterium]|jgi:heterodisulfide reductase subunit B|nr:CoB--CoM heterodisulfide reductase iron-sulfur subunit B family protein [Actinomycetota bacterium]
MEEKNINKIAYYPGCSLNSTALDYNLSIKKLLDALDIEYEEIEDWNCCGTTPAHHTNEELSAALSARNLLLAKKMGYEQILCPCVSCYIKLTHAANLLNADPEELNEYEQIKRQQLVDDLKDMGLKVEPEYNFKIYSILNFLVEKEELIKKKYQEAIGNENYRRPQILDRIKPACYYGCVIFRAKEADKFDQTENPMTMERLLKIVGIDSREFQFKTECCGAIMSLTHKDAVLKLSGKILEMTEDCGANCIVLFCQLCQQNLDLRQSQINKAFKTNYHIPVIYITQVLGMALGLSEKEVMLDRLFVEPSIK